MEVRANMTETKLQRAASNDEAEIRELIERWSKAVRDENRAAIRADHDPEMLMFDVPPPLLSRGLGAYMATWESFSCHGPRSQLPLTFTT